MATKRKSKAGTYYRPLPIDHRLLALLPEVGTIGGIHWKGRRVRDLVAELDQADVTPDLVSSRLRSMRAAGYVENFGAVGREVSVWAKTPAGVELEDSNGA